MSWVDIDSQKGNMFTGRKEKKVFLMKGSTKYACYRIHFLGIREESRGDKGISIDVAPPTCTETVVDKKRVQTCTTATARELATTTKPLLQVGDVLMYKDALLFEAPQGTSVVAGAERSASLSALVGGAAVAIAVAVMRW